MIISYHKIGVIAQISRKLETRQRNRNEIDGTKELR